MRETDVVLGIGDHALQAEVLDLLERLPGVRVVDAAAEAAAVDRAIRRRRPAAVIASPEIASHLRRDGADLLVVAPRETTEALRTALRAGAAGFYHWPDERDALASGAERSGAVEHPGPAGRVIAVHAPRGGAGATFVATHLAGAIADGGTTTALVDLDALYGDVTAALGFPVTDEGSTGDGETLGDDGPVLREVRGFRVLLAPTRAVVPDGVDTAWALAAIRALWTRFEAVVLHLPRALDASVRAALDLADEILLVVTPDVLAVRATIRALEVLDTLALRERSRLVVNRATRGEVSPDDIQRALDIPVAGVIRADRAVERAQNRGELLDPRSGPAARGVAALARSVLQGATT